MKTTTENNVRARHEDIAELAKQIWESEGRKAGRDVEHWLRAEQQLISGKGRRSALQSNQPAAESVPYGTSRTIKLPESITKPAHA
jgi:hypothetical protein